MPLWIQQNLWQQSRASNYEDWSCLPPAKAAKRDSQWLLAQPTSNLLRRRLAKWHRSLISTQKRRVLRAKVRLVLPRSQDRWLQGFWIARGWAHRLDLSAFLKWQRSVVFGVLLNNNVPWSIIWNIIDPYWPRRHTWTGPKVHRNPFR